MIPYVLKFEVEIWCSQGGDDEITGLPDMTSFTLANGCQCFGSTSLQPSSVLSTYSISFPYTHSV
jgi:hypothetical protein